jgi:DnaK suppressor protein
MKTKLSPRKELQRTAFLREKLLDRRQDLLDVLGKRMDSSRMKGNPAGPGDETDTATHSLEQETDFSLAQINSDEIEKIDTALRLLSEGSYGKCVSCKRDIAVKRLEAMPFATQCISCQQEEERSTRVFEPVTADESWSRLGEMPQDVPDREKYLDELQKDWEEV